MAARRHRGARLAASTILGVAVVGSSGCRRISRRTIRDTEGRAFLAECDREQRCELKQTAGPAPPPGEPGLALHAPGWLVSICTVGEPGRPGDASQCRALVCDGDADCPPQHGAKDGKCLNGWCTEPAHEITVDDSVMLCLAGTGLGKETERQTELYAVALNCGSPCRVPKPCEQPSRRPKHGQPAP